MALALLTLCVGALLHVTPPTLAATDAGPRVVLQSGPAAAALPGSSMAGAAESGESTTPTPPRRHGTPTTRHDVSARTLLHGPTGPEVTPRRSGASLLGLDSAPANAPPSA